jgi:hypothetical protein
MSNKDAMRCHLHPYAVLYNACHNAGCTAYTELSEMCISYSIQLRCVVSAYCMLQLGGKELVYVRLATGAKRSGTHDRMTDR